MTPEVPACPQILAPVEACVISIQTFGAFFIHKLPGHVCKAVNM